MGDCRFAARGALVVAPIAVSLVLVVAADLFLRTFASLNRLPLGFEPEPLLVAELNLQASGVPAEGRGARRAPARAAAAVPGVRSASISAERLLTGGGWSTDMIAIDDARMVSPRQVLALAERDDARLVRDDGHLSAQVAGEDVVADANQVLFVTTGEPYGLLEPLGGGYAELIVTPSIDVLAEIARVNDTGLRRHPWFRRRSRRAEPRLQVPAARLLHAAHGDGDGLAAEELTVTLVRSALCADRRVPEASPSTRRAIRRAKEFVQAHLAGPLRLSHVAQAAGVSPAYLTHLFRVVEGVPLHQYVLQLRLARALVELPEADDLTRLALDLGFSSHSHFAAAFRKAYGCTPSSFRERTRRVDQRRIA